MRSVNLVRLFPGGQGPSCSEARGALERPLAIAKFRKRGLGAACGTCGACAYLLQLHAVLALQHLS
jgi:hypothetical protein